MTVILVIVALQAVMSTIRVQRMVGDIGRNDTELLAAYLARNKKADKAVDDEMANYPDDFETVYTGSDFDELLEWIEEHEDNGK